MLLENDWVVQGDITAAKVAFFNMSVDVLAHDASVIKVMARREYDHKYRRGRWRSTPSGVLYRRMCPDLEVSRWRVFVTGPGLVRMADIINEGLRHDESRVQDEDTFANSVPLRCAGTISLAQAGLLDCAGTNATRAQVLLRRGDVVWAQTRVERCASWHRRELCIRAHRPCLDHGTAHLKASLAVPGQQDRAHAHRSFRVCLAFPGLPTRPCAVRGCRFGSESNVEMTLRGLNQKGHWFASLVTVPSKELFVSQGWHLVSRLATVCY